MTLTNIARFFKSPETPTWKKFLGVAALAYVVLPVDLIPDVVPLIGWLDDVGIVAAFVSAMSGELKKQTRRSGVEVIDGSVVR